MSQYEVVAFETKDGIKCLDVGLALYAKLNIPITGTKRS